MNKIIEERNITIILESVENVKLLSKVRKAIDNSNLEEGNMASDYYKGILHEVAEKEGQDIEARFSVSMYVNGSVKVGIMPFFFKLIKEPKPYGNGWTSQGFNEFIIFLNSLGYISEGKHIWDTPEVWNNILERTSELVEHDFFVDVHNK